MPGNLDLFIVTKTVPTVLVWLPTLTASVTLLLLGNLVLVTVSGTVPTVLSLVTTVPYWYGTLSGTVRYWSPSTYWYGALVPSIHTVLVT